MVTTQNERMKIVKAELVRLIEGDVIGPDHTMGWRESWLEQVLGRRLMDEFRQASRGWTCASSAGECVFYTHDLTTWLRGDPNLDE